MTLIWTSWNGLTPLIKSALLAVPEEAHMTAAAITLT